MNYVKKDMKNSETACAKFRLNQKIELRAIEKPISQ